MVKIHHHHARHQHNNSKLHSILRILLSFCTIDTLLGFLVGGTLFLSIRAASVSTAAAPAAVVPTTIQQQRRDSTTPQDAVTVAYAVSVTGCGSDPITEGAAVLKHSIHRVASSHYNYRMFAIVHPDAMECAGAALALLGYTVLTRDTPVPVSEIQGEYLQSKIESNGCCGEKELIKLEAYTLTDYPLVVHVDLDVLILKPLDEVFDLMLGKTTTTTNTNEIPESVANMLMYKDNKNEPLPESVNAVFTMDYNMVRPGVQYKPVQGGFLILQPSLQVYEEYKSIIRQGDFRQKGGWGGKVGPFYGSMTFQGLIPYYYHVLHPGTSLELNRCMFNQMCDNPRTEKTVNDVVHGDCRTGETDCTDCRSVSVETVVTTHFTLCQKPWWCITHDQDAIQHRLCRQLTHAWYQIRSDLEVSWGRPQTGTGTFQKDHFYGYCKSPGKHGYLPIAAPYGKGDAAEGVAAIRKSS